MGGRPKGLRNAMPANRGRLWMAVTDDEYELPIAVALSQRELGEMLNVNHEVISHRYYRGIRGSCTRMQYKICKVDIGKEEFKKLIQYECNIK